MPSFVSALVPPNSTPTHGRYHTLRCTVTLAPWRVRLRYVALGRYGFIARRVRVTRA